MPGHFCADEKVMISTCLDMIAGLYLPSNCKESESSVSKLTEDLSVRTQTLKLNVVSMSLLFRCS